MGEGMNSDEIRFIAEKMGKEVKIVDGEVKVRFHSSNLWVDFKPDIEDADAMKVFKALAVKCTKDIYDDLIINNTEGVWSLSKFNAYREVLPTTLGTGKTLNESISRAFLAYHGWEGKV